MQKKGHKCRRIGKIVNKLLGKGRYMHAFPIRRGKKGKCWKKRHKCIKIEGKCWGKA